MKKKTTSKRSVFQNPSFIRSLCKVVGALRFSCITLFTYAPKSSKDYFVLNILKLDDFMFSTKILCQMFFKLVKGFKLKKLVVEPKMVQSVEPNEEPVHRQLNRSRDAKNLLSLSEWLFNRSRSGRGPTVTCQALNVNG